MVSWIGVSAIVAMVIGFAALPVVLTFLANKALKRSIRNKVVLRLLNFLTFVSFFFIEMILVGQFYARRSMRGRLVGYDPYYLTTNEVITQPNRRLQELDKLKSENKVSQEVFDKAKSNLENK